MTNLPDPELSRAVLIGAGRFAGMPALPAVPNNLDDLKSALTDERTGILRRDHCTVVSNPESTAAFMRELRAAAREAEDLLLVYYAGHGLRDQLSLDRLYLAVYQTDPEGPDGNAVPFDSVRKAIQNSPARRKVLILDCCYSGLAVGTMSGSGLQRDEVAVRGTAVMTSCPRNRESLAPPGDRHTAFTGELITLLRRGSRIPGEPLTTYTAFASLCSALARRDLPEPMFESTSAGTTIPLRRLPARPEPAFEPLARSTPVSRPSPKPLARVTSVSMPRAVVPLSLPTVPEPATVPALPPVTHPPVPVQQETVIAWQRIVRVLLVASAWLLAWIGCALGLAFVIGGYSAAIAEASSAPVVGGSDRALAVSGIALFVGFGLPLGWRIVRARKTGRRRLTLRAVNPTLDARLAKVRRWMLIAGLVACVGIGLGGAFSSVTPTDGGPDTLSSLASTIALVCWLAEGTVACAYALWRSRAGTSADVPALSH